MADGVVLVVDPSKARRRDLRRAREAIEAVGGRILGVVVNRLTETSGAYYYYRSSHSSQQRPKGGQRSQPAAPQSGNPVSGEAGLQLLGKEPE
jgi:non-specific protein-tyrosine kinase